MNKTLVKATGCHCSSEMSLTLMMLFSSTAAFWHLWVSKCSSCRCEPIHASSSERDNALFESSVWKSIIAELVFCNQVSLPTISQAADKQLKVCLELRAFINKRQWLNDLPQQITVLWCCWRNCALKTSPEPAVWKIHEFIKAWGRSGYGKKKTASQQLVVPTSVCNPVNDPSQSQLQAVEAIRGQELSSASRLFGLKCCCQKTKWPSCCLWCPCWRCCPPACVWRRKPSCSAPARPSTTGSTSPCCRLPMASSLAAGRGPRCVPTSSSLLASAWG